MKPRISVVIYWWEIAATNTIFTTFMFIIEKINKPHMINSNEIWLFSSKLICASQFIEVYISLKCYNILRFVIYIREKYLRVNNEDHNKQ